MANPFAHSRTFHRIGHVTNTSVWKLLPTPTGLGVLTSVGRKTGKRRTRAMRMVVADGLVYAVALLGERTDWLHNIRNDPNVRIKLGRRTHDAVARELTDPGDRARAMAAYRPIAGWYDYFDYANFVWDIPSRRKLLDVHDAWFARGVPVAFELKP